MSKTLQIPTVRGQTRGATYFLEFFISSKLYCNVGYDPGHIGSVSLEVPSETFLFPNLDQSRYDALELLTFTLHLDLGIYTILYTIYYYYSIT